MLDSDTMEQFKEVFKILKNIEEVKQAGFSKYLENLSAKTFVK